MDTTALKNRMSGKLNAPQLEQEGREPTVETNTALAPVESGFVALSNNALDIINENLKNQPMTFSLFDVVKSPSGGSTVFAVPGLTGEEPAKELTGIILSYTTPRAYWETPEPIEGEPPVCFSQDSLTSSEGKACAHCEFNTHGSRNGGETNAKACKESVAIFLLRPDNIIPIIEFINIATQFCRYRHRIILGFGNGVAFV